MDFLSKKTIFKNKNICVTMLTDVMSGDFFYIVKTGILGDLKKEILKDIQGLEEKDAIETLKNKLKNF